MVRPREGLVPRCSLPTSRRGPTVAAGGCGRNTRGSWVRVDGRESVGVCPCRWRPTRSGGVKRSGPPPVGTSAGKLRSMTRERLGISSEGLTGVRRRSQGVKCLRSRRESWRTTCQRTVACPDPESAQHGPSRGRAASGDSGSRGGSCIVGIQRSAESWESGRTVWQGLSGCTAGISAGSETTLEQGARPDAARAA